MTSVGAISSSVHENSGSSGEKSMVGTVFSHKTTDMQRVNLRTEGSSPKKRFKIEMGEEVISLSSSVIEHKHDNDLPPDFLEPIPSEEDARNCLLEPAILQGSSISAAVKGLRKENQASSRQFWKAGDYEGSSVEKKSLIDGMDHVRVHPKFLHSNATSHKWALGAVAELLDNALDEVSKGATFVKIDILYLNSQQGKNSPMLLFEDNGGGMDPDGLRHCMSFGYSVKSKMSNTIGQYGNGFKTSTMRLGADVIVFSCSPAREGRTATHSIGLLSYTFLRETSQQDIVVPMIDFEVQSYGLKKLIRGNINDWNKNMEIIKQWSPFATEQDLLEQFRLIDQQGTRIIIFNLWENDQGALELDFDSHPDDIQLRGVNRDTKKIALAQHLPNSKHFLTYQHSLRSYASILYLKLPRNFKIILRGAEIEHHRLVDDMMIVEKHSYRPSKSSLDDKTRDEEQSGYLQNASGMKAVVTLGFVKDAKEHADVQGFNIYHKNRLIKPFWRVWNASGSQGRGIIGILEANFVEPAHDKQGFERTSVLARLEARLLKMQKSYWAVHSHKIGYYNHHAKKKKEKPKTPRLNGREGFVDFGAQDGVKAFPRSSRSRMCRLPARRFRSDTQSSTHSGLAPLSELPVVLQCSKVKVEGNLVLDDIDKNLDSNRSELLAVASNAVQRFEWLKAQLRSMKQQLEDNHKKMGEALKERDALKLELEEERKLGEARDAELRKKLKESSLRVRELETENKKLKTA